MWITAVTRKKPICYSSCACYFSLWWCCLLGNNSCYKENQLLQQLCLPYFFTMLLSAKEKTTKILLISPLRQIFSRIHTHQKISQERNYNRFGRGFFCFFTNFFLQCTRIAVLNRSYLFCKTFDWYKQNSVCT